MNRNYNKKADYQHYEAPEDFVNNCMEQLERNIKQLRIALIFSLAVLFGAFYFQSLLA